MLLENKSEFILDEIHKEDLKVDILTVYEENNNDEGLPHDDLRSKDETDEDGRYNFEQSKKNFGTDLNYEPKILWKNVIGLAILHILGLYGFLLCFTHARFATSIYVFILINLTLQGLTAGNHRLWAHRAYKARLPLKIFLIICQTGIGHNSLWVWARNHRLHHRYSDTDADPHNARRGFFFAHLGWLMTKRHPLVKKLGKTIDMSDLEADPWLMFQKRYYYFLHFVFGFLIPVFIPVYLWNENFWVSVAICYFAKVIYQLNAVLAVNSVAHFYGTKPYDKNLVPTDNKTLAIFIMGEGWHNFHHAFPWDYRMGEWGGLYDTSATFIKLMHYIGQAYDLKMASPAMIKNRMQRTGDGTIYEHIHLKTTPKQL